MNPSHSTLSVPRSRGVSLIELMVALLIASLLLLGIIQIFGASRSSAQLQEGLSRVQENGRFATQFLQRQLRMVGYMGCGADAGRIEQESFVNHFALWNKTVPGGDRFRFTRPIEAFTAGSMTAPSDLSATAFTAGSDVLILRVFSEESVPIVNVQRAANILTVGVGPQSTAFLPAAGNLSVLGMQNCRSADIFAGSLDSTGLIVTANGVSASNVYLDPTCGNCPWDYRISNAYLNAKPIVGDSTFNAELHRGEYIALYVRNNAAGNPSLYVRRFDRTNMTLAADEELVDGVENMQLRFGYDTTAVPDGAIDEYRTAQQVAAGLTNPIEIDRAWSRVVSVQVALLIRSPDPSMGAADARTYTLLGTSITRPGDGLIREVYETTIGLRNRLFNS
ncbi:PilW family protein [Dokdonella sp. MW10]|uniref:PilW family protein n=1 Tax=Dokdonella sp. MW10 TaxID=2992926 RepID=UPI003F7D4AC0